MSRRCCTPPPRTCPVSPRSATSRASCSTPSWPDGCSATRGWRSARMLEEVLGFRLAKEHSAADWSVRPLPAEMLKYAALDVEVLVELRDALAEQLREQGKAEWATAGVRRDRRRSAAAAAGRPVAAHLGDTQGAHPARPRRRARAVADAGRDRPRRRPVTAPGAERPGDRRRGAGRGRQAAADRPAAARADQRVPRALRPQVRATAGSPPCSGPAQLDDAELPEVGGRGAPRRPAARAPLGRARPGGGRAAGRRPGGDRRDRRRAPRCPWRTCFRPDALRRLAWEPPDPGDQETISAALRATGPARGRPS